MQNIVWCARKWLKQQNEVASNRIVILNRSQNLSMFFKWLTKKPKPHHILENVAPGLIACLEILSPDQRSRLLGKAFELIVRTLPKIESDIQMLLQISLKDNVLSGDQIRMIEPWPSPPMKNTLS